MLTGTAGKIEDQTGKPALNARDEEFLLGEWRVLPQLNRLRHHSGAQRQLEPRLMHLLCVLAGNPERVLTREELVAEIWPRVIVNENSLTRAVSELRKQLLISGHDNPVYIETIPKRGYRLLQPALATGPARCQADTARPGRWSLPNWRRALIPGATGFALALLTAGWLGINTGPQTRLPPTALQDELMYPRAPLFDGSLTVQTSDPGRMEKGTVATPVLSRDGSRFAYIRYDHLGSTIYLGNLGETAEPVAVYYRESYLYNLSWSPLGNALLFAQKPTMTNALFTPRKDSATLMQLDLDTLEATRLVGEDPAAEDKGQNGGVKLT